MGKTFHSRQEFKKLVKELGISAAKAKAARHPDGTHAKGLRRSAPGKILIYEDRNRFGDAYEKSSRMRRIRRYIKHAARNAAKAELWKGMEENNK
jgi:hypothetical protein